MVVLMVIGVRAMQRTYYRDADSLWIHLVLLVLVVFTLFVIASTYYRQDRAAETYNSSLFFRVTEICRESMEAASRPYNSTACEQWARSVFSFNRIAIETCQRNAPENNKHFTECLATASITPQ
jgi:hypothetical protein